MNQQISDSSQFQDFQSTQKIECLKSCQQQKQSSLSQGLNSLSSFTQIQVNKPSLQPIHTTKTLQIIIGNDIKAVFQLFQEQKAKNKQCKLYPILFEHFAEGIADFANIPQYALILGKESTKAIQVFQQIINFITTYWPSSGYNALFYEKKNNGNELLPIPPTLSVPLTVLNQHGKFQIGFWSILYLMHPEGSSTTLNSNPLTAQLTKCFLITLILPLIVISQCVDSIVKLADKVPYPGKYKFVSQFKKKYTEQARIQLYQKWKTHDMIPIIVEKHQLSFLPSIGQKFQVKKSMNFQTFYQQIRNKIDKQNSELSNTTLYCYIKGNLVDPQSSLGIIYENYKEKDGLLYIVYQEQDSF